MGGVNALIGALILSLAAAARAQLPAPPATTEDALRQMSDQAGVIFTGQVTAIRHVEAVNGSTGILAIDFAVDDAILGAAPNSTYTLREWAGLAPNGDTTFVIGRRYLMILHAPGPSGLSSPVGGPDGAIPILPTAEPASPDTPDTAGLAAQAVLAQTVRAQTAKPAGCPTSRRGVGCMVPVSPAHTAFRLASTVDSGIATSATSTASAGCPTSRRDVGCTATSSQSTARPSLASSSIDLRWIAARVMAPLAYASGAPGPGEARPIIDRANLALPATNLLAPDTAQIVTSPTDLAVLPSASAPAPAAAQPPTSSAAYTDVLALLRTWQRDARASR